MGKERGTGGGAERSRVRIVEVGGRANGLEGGGEGRVGDGRGLIEGRRTRSEVEDEPGDQAGVGLGRVIAGAEAGAGSD